MVSKKDVCVPQTFFLSTVNTRNLEGYPGIEEGGPKVNNLRCIEDNVLITENKKKTSKDDWTRMIEGKRSRGKGREKLFDELTKCLKFNISCRMTSRCTTSNESSRCVLWSRSPTLKRRAPDWLSF